MKITFGMSEVLVLSGVYLYTSAFAFSLTLFGLGLLGKLMAMGMEKAIEDQRQQTTENSVKTVVDTIVNAVSSAVDVAGAGPKNGTFH